MLYITKQQYLWISNDIQIVYRIFGTEGFSDILWEIYCTESVTDNEGVISFIKFYGVRAHNYDYKTLSLQTRMAMVLWKDIRSIFLSR